MKENNKYNKHDIAKQLNMQDLALVSELLETGVQIHVKPDVTLMGSKKYNEAVPIVINGCLDAYLVSDTSKKVLLYTIFPGEICSMTLRSAMLNRTSKVDIVSSCPCDLLILPASAISPLQSKYSVWNNFTLRCMDQQCESLLNTVANISFMHMETRLLYYLKKKMRCFDSKPFINMSHKEIAEELNTAREVVSRKLKSLEKNGKVRIYRNKIRVLEEM